VDRSLVYYHIYRGRRPRFCRLSRAPFRITQSCRSHRVDTTFFDNRVFRNSESSIFATVLTLVEVSGILIIIFIGIPSFGDVNLLETPMGFSGVVGAASLVFFAYLGFEGMANMSEEMKNPERDLPKALLLALFSSTILYILVAISAVSVLGWLDLSSSSAPLAAVAAQVLSQKADLLLS
jgi:APA family basic amino acid/polyamine antiporter